MNILHLTPFYFPRIGGVEKHLFELNKVMVEDGHSVTVMTQGHAPNLPTEEVVNGVRVIRLPVNSTATKSRYKLSLWQGLKKQGAVFQNADVIHIHDVFFWIIPFLPWLWWQRKKVFMTFHGYEGNGAPKTNQVFWHRVAAWLTRGSIGVGGFHPKWYGVHPTEVTFGAVSPLTFSESRPKHREGKSKPLRVMFLGRLVADLGIKEYIQGLKLWHEQTGRSAILDVYGDGPLRLECQALTKKSDPHFKVAFRGFVENAGQFLSQYDIAFVSSYLAILEGLTVEVPIVAFYNHEIKKDYLELTPFVEWIKLGNSPEAVAQAVTEYTNHQMNQSKQSRKWALSQTWQKLAQTYYRLWQTSN